MERHSVWMCCNTLLGPSSERVRGNWEMVPAAWPPDSVCGGWLEVHDALLTLMCLPGPPPRSYLEHSKAAWPAFLQSEHMCLFLHCLYVQPLPSVL